MRTKEEIPNGKAYRKFYQSWDITDIRYDWRFETKIVDKKMFLKTGKNQHYRVHK